MLSPAYIYVYTPSVPGDEARGARLTQYCMWVTGLHIVVFKQLTASYCMYYTDSAVGASPAGLAATRPKFGMPIKKWHHAAE